MAGDGAPAADAAAQLPSEVADLEGFVDFERRDGEFEVALGDDGKYV